MDDLTRAALDARRGDRSGLEAFVRLSQPDVWRLCRWLSSEAEADDLAQETYVRAMRAIGGFRAEAGARSWLLTIARNTCADHVRRQQRLRRVTVRLDAERTSPAHQPDHADGIVLESMLRGLDEDRRAAFVLTQVLGLSYGEAAEVAGCPVGTIRSRIARARLDLLDALGSDAEEQTGS